MAGFKADDAVPKLEWDFTKYVSGAKGVSPEPGNLALLQFNMRMRSLVDAERRIVTAQLTKETQKAEGASKEEKQALLDRWATMDLDAGATVSLDELAAIMPAEEGERLHRKQAELVAELLQNSPSVDQIMGLPGRIRQAYFGWIAGQLMDPEFGAAGTS